MRRILPVAALVAAALAAAACDKPGTKSAYNNSGASATPAMPATQGPAASPSEAPAVSDTASPSTAPTPAK